MCKSLYFLSRATPPAALLVLVVHAGRPQRRPGASRSSDERRYLPLLVILLLFSSNNAATLLVLIMHAGRPQRRRTMVVGPGQQHPHMIGPVAEPERGCNIAGGDQQGAPAPVHSVLLLHHRRPYTSTNCSCPRSTSSARLCSSLRLAGRVCDGPGAQALRACCRCATLFLDLNAFALERVRGDRIEL